ncbi:hypothetical protein D3C80_2119270 [compost metagenome]
MVAGPIRFASDGGTTGLNVFRTLVPVPKWPDDAAPLTERSTPWFGELFLSIRFEFEFG